MIPKREVSNKIKAWIIFSLTLAILCLHYFTFHGEKYYHAVYRMLFYVPLILSGFWFGFKGSMATCIGIVLAYTPYYIETWSGFSIDDFDKLMEGILFIIIAVILGILAEKEKEKTQALLETESLAAVGKAVSEIAHDMKAPLMAIGGFARQVERKMDNDSPEKHKLELVVKETARLEDMVRGMLDFGKPVNLQKSEVDLNEIIQEIGHMVVHEAVKSGVTVEPVLDPHLPVIMADPHKIKQVLLNLITNAIQASPSGKKVVIRTYTKGKNTVVEVEDEGPGIMEEHKESVFHPFFTTKKSGTGLGLGISKKIVEAHQGKIYFRSNFQKGVTFVVELPF